MDSDRPSERRTPERCNPEPRITERSSPEHGITESGITESGITERWTPEEWDRYLGAELDFHVQVPYGRPRSTPVRTRSRIFEDGREGLAIRLHGRFAEAPEDTREALARWLRVGRRARRACVVLDEWIHARIATEPEPDPRPALLEPAGQAYHLEVLAAPLYTGVFEGEFHTPDQRPGLTWGRRGKSSSRRSLRLGSFDSERGVVRIHPVLDRTDVPEWFVRYVLMHEILHAALPPRLGNGNRWVHHGPEFRAREARYADYKRALRWEERHLPRLIRQARRGVPQPNKAHERPAGVEAQSIASVSGASAVRWLQGKLFS